MELQVLLFASLKEAAGVDRITVQVETRDAITVSALLQACSEQYPAIAKWLPYARVAVNRTYASQSQSVSADDEIALLPPVSGGCFK